jgi:hypothetical protein
MKNINFFLILIFVNLIFNSAVCFSAGYLGIMNGDISQEFATYDNQAQEDKELIDGNTFGLEIGYFLTNSVAFELGFSDVQFKESEVNGADFTYFSDINGSFLNYGFRWFLADFFNVRMGVNRSEIKYNIKTTGTLEVDDKTKIESNQYYGFGFGMTFQKMQAYYDWVQYPNEDGKNGSSQTVGLRLFF